MAKNKNRRLSAKGRKPGQKTHVSASQSSESLSKKIFNLAALSAIWVFVGLCFFVGWCALDLPDIHQVSQPVRRPSVVMMALDGSVFARSGDMAGERVALKDLPPFVPQAIISIEDRRFYHHFGVDLWGIVRAAFRNAKAGHMVQGGSTITQQLAKNLFLSPERTAKRKIQEMILALWLEQTYSKDDILTAYLNRVYLGNGAYGVDAAAHTYFSKSANDLSLPEAAMIAGLLRAPSRYAPTHDPVAAKNRAGVVLQTMLEEGYITDAQRRHAVTLSASLVKTDVASNEARYFRDWIMDQVEGILASSPQDIVVSTTLDLKAQHYAEHVVTSQLAATNGRDAKEAALVTLAPDGAVRAMIGGGDYRESQFNRATQAMRQPGSAFKPIVYLAAIEKGLTPDEEILDAPIEIGDWSPENFDGKYHGMVTARYALAESINTVAVRVFQRAGASNVIRTARALGITSQLEHDAALALGASEVTPIELAGAYAALAIGGKAVSPYGIKEIRSKDGTQVLYRHADVTPPQVVDASSVETLVGMMQEVVRSGTGKRAALDRPVAGKTGTSSDYRDAWFAGFTGDYTTVVWIGNDDGKPMRKVIGGSLPAQIWHDYMVEAEAGLPQRDLLAGITDSHSSSGIGIDSDTAKAFGDFISHILDTQ